MAVRRAERSRGTGRRGAPAAAPRSTGLTTRAAIFGLMVCAILVSAALPLRELIAQRGTITGTERTQAAQRQRVSALEQQRAQLDDPAYVASLARERLHFVRPGEIAYEVIGPGTPGPGVPAAGTVAVGSDTAPWYSQLYGSLRVADSESR